MSWSESANARTLAALGSQLGATLRPARLLELADGKISVRFAVGWLRAQGQSVRPVRAGARELSRLQTPTLLFLHSGEACILDATRGRQASLRRGDGRWEQRRLRALAPEVQFALERAPHVRLGRRFASSVVGVLWQCRATLGRLTLLTLALAGFGLLGPWLTRQAMGPVLHDAAPSLLDTLALAMLGAACMEGWLGWIGSRTRISLDVELVHATNQATFRRALALPYAEHQKQGLGSLLQALRSAELVARLFASASIGPVFDALSALIQLFALAMTATRLAVVLVGISAVTASVSILLSRRSAELHSEELDEAARSRARLHALIAGIATLKAARGERQGLLRWLQALVAERGLGLKRELTESWLSLWLSGAQRVGSVVTLAWAAFEVLEGRLTVSDLIYLSMLSAGYLHSSLALCRTLLPLWSARAQLARVDALLAVGSHPAVDAAEPSAPLPAPGRRAATRAPAILIEDAWFRYSPDQAWISKGYSLSVEQFQHTQIQGPSGMGKSTILRLIAGLYRPERGSVSVLGRDPWQERTNVTYLPQHAQLLSGSLRHNLQQLSGASLDRLMAACQQTGLDRWIDSLPMGIETIASAGGGNFSGGQRQWVVLTAAVASERPIVLLDEATSQMDPLLCARLSRSRLFDGKTTVSVSHDR